jgi:hypothetical protein
MDANTANFLRARRRVIPAGGPQRVDSVQVARPARGSLLQRIFRRKEVSTFHRCLAVHMHYAERRGFFH